MEQKVLAELEKASTGALKVTLKIISDLLVLNHKMFLSRETELCRFLSAAIIREGEREGRGRGRGEREKGEEEGEG